MSKVHMWHRMAYMGMVEVKCGRLVKASQFTPEMANVTCKACLNAMDKQKGKRS